VEKDLRAEIKLALEKSKKEPGLNLDVEFFLDEVIEIIKIEREKAKKGIPFHGDIPEDKWEGLPQQKNPWLNQQEE